MRKSIVSAVVVAAMIGCGAAAAADLDISALNSKALKYVLPDKIEWQVTRGVDTAFLYGHPNQPGFYVLMFKCSPTVSAHT